MPATVPTVGGDRHGSFTSIGVEGLAEAAGRIIQGTVTGMGFLGAGMIMKEGGQVIGLTRAADVCAMAAVGIMIGAGEYTMGSLTGLVLLVLIKEKVPCCRGLAGSPNAAES